MSEHDILQRNQTVDWFASRMKVKLAERVHKGNWLDQDPNELARALMGEIGELAHATYNSDNESILWECVDVASYAMMLADHSAQCDLVKRPLRIWPDAFTRRGGPHGELKAIAAEAVTKMLRAGYPTDSFVTLASMIAQHYIDAMANGGERPRLAIILDMLTERLQILGLRDPNAPRW